MGTAETCPYCGHPGIHRGGGGGRSSCDDCDRCWAERQEHERPPHHNRARIGPGHAGPPGHVEEADP